MEEESKAVQEVAKAVGKGIDAAREAGGFISTYIAGPLEQGMGIFEDRLKYVRWERQQRLIQRAQEFLQQSGLDKPTRAVPLNLALPIIQGAALEEDDELQDRWAALLVNAANANFAEIRRSYTSILEQLTVLDARILDVLYALPFEESQHEGVTTLGLPNSARLVAADEQSFPLPQQNIVISLSNLARLGCLRAGATWGGGENFGRVNTTVAGKAFIEACKVKRAT